MHIHTTVAPWREWSMGMCIQSTATYLLTYSLHGAEYYLKR